MFLSELDTTHPRCRTFYYLIRIKGHNIIIIMFFVILRYWFLSRLEEWLLRHFSSTTSNKERSLLLVMAGNLYHIHLMPWVQPLPATYHYPRPNTGRQKSKYTWRNTCNKTLWYRHLCVRPQSGVSGGWEEGRKTDIPAACWTSTAWMRPARGKHTTHLLRSTGCQHTLDCGRFFMGLDEESSSPSLFPGAGTTTEEHPGDMTLHQYHYWRTPRRHD